MYSNSHHVRLTSTWIGTSSIKKMPRPLGLMNWPASLDALILVTRRELPAIYQAFQYYRRWGGA
jgi:hypothetical protein